MAVSTKLRSQFRGHSQALENTQDAISLLQTAEGGYSSINEILQRLRELAVRAANDSLSDQDRMLMDKEREQLTEEIDRLRDTVEFNGIKLLQGTGGGGNVWGKIQEAVARVEEGGTPSNVDVRVSFTPTGTPTNNGSGNDPMDYYDGGGAGEVDQTEFQNEVIAALQEWSQVFQDEWGFSLNIINLGLENDTDPPATSGSTYPLDEDGSGTIEPGEPGDFRISMPSIDGQFGVVSVGFAPGGILGETGTEGGDYYMDRDEDWRRDAVAPGADPGSLSVMNSAVTMFGRGLGLPINSDPDSVMFAAASLQSFATEHGTIPQVDRQTLREEYESNPLAFHVGANRDETIRFARREVSSSSLHVDQLDFSSRESAEIAIQTYTRAINELSGIRSLTGSKINRLEQVTDFLQIQRQSTQQSESRIRDADFAAEATTRARQQILMQAGTSVLQQSVQTPQLALRLLQ
jgi:flagellin